MSENYQIVINGLKQKIEVIISRYEQVIAENEKLCTELDNCKYELETKISKEKELEKKVNNLQLVEAFKSSSADVKEAKQKIARLVKEIDKCIALLND